MASQLNLDRSDAGVDELVSQWKDGGKYRVTLDITQSKSSPSMNTFEVTGVEDLGEGVEEELAKSETETPMHSMRRNMGAKGMGSSKPPVSVEY